MRDVVVLSPGFRSWHASVRYAAQLAAAIRATLTGLYVGARSAAVPGPPLLVEELAAYAKDELQEAVLAGRDFAQWASRLGAHEARWQVAIGRADDALAMACDWSDAVVLPCGTSTPVPADRLIGEVVRSGAACIAVPETSIAPGRVLRAVVAWNGTAASSRALHAALPLLRKAEAVVLLQSREAEVGTRPDAHTHLRKHGITVEAIERIEEGDEAAGERLLAQVADRRADLLVMGAGERRRLGRPSFGATTAHVLAECRVPVFLKR